MKKAYWNNIWETSLFYLRGTWEGLSEHHCFAFASGIAYNTLLCVIPLSLILFQIFSVVLQNNRFAQHAVIRYIRQSLPIEQYGSTVQNWFEQQITYLTDMSVLPGIVALAALIWLVSALFSSMRTAIGAIYRIKAPHNAAILKLRDIWNTVVVASFLLFTVLIGPIIFSLQRAGKDYLPEEISKFIHSSLATIIPIVLTTIIFYYLYRSLTYKVVTRAVAIRSSLTTIILIEIMKYAFGFYVRKLSGLGAIYGAYTFIAVIAIWAYYVALVFLIGANAGRLFSDRHNKRHVLHTSGT